MTTVPPHPLLAAGIEGHMAIARAFLGGTLLAEVELDRGAVTTFGRGETCTLRFAEKDNGVSRVAGCVSFDAGEWRITNLSTARPLRVIDEETRMSVTLSIVKGKTQPVFVAQSDLVTVFLDGDSSRYALALSGLTPETGPLAFIHAVGEPSTIFPFDLTQRQREILVALAWGYLQRYPHYDPRPATYAAAGALVGATEKRAEKHIAEIRRRLVEAGLPGLVDVPDARAQLCERALELRIIGPRDLVWLEERLAKRALALDED